MSEEIIVKKFDNEPIEFIKKENDIWVTARTLGNALEYAHPRLSIMKLYNAHKMELQGKTTVTQTVTAGKLVETRFFNEKGAYLLTCFSRKSKAEKFRDWITDVAIEIRKKGYYIEPSIASNSLAIIQEQVALTIQRTPIVKALIKKNIFQDKKIHSLKKDLKEVRKENKEIKEENTSLKEQFEEWETNQRIFDETIKKIKDLIVHIKNKHDKWIWIELRTKFTFSKLDRISETKGRMILFYIEGKYHVKWEDLHARGE